MSNNYKIRRKLLSPPGDTLQETIDNIGMSQHELAERLGKKEKNVNQIIKGKEPITVNTALSLQNVLNIPADFWLERESKYRIELAEIEAEEQAEKYSEWVKKFPIKEMQKMKWIPETKTISDRTESLIRYFGIAKPGSWNRIYRAQTANATFRKSPSISSNPYSISAWLRQGEIQARELKLKKYSRSKFRKALHRIKEIANGHPRDFFKATRDICGECGVALVYTPNIPKAAISGSFRWLYNRTTPLIQLSGRYKTNDHLWFTFFHEAGHLLLHGKKDVFLEEAEGIESNRKKEEEADRFARNFLINEKAYIEFAGKGVFTKETITEFSNANNVNPGIVVGRLQHDGYVGHGELKGFKIIIT
ncbi:MAG: HigA family addiction module antitoxin [Bacteroidetes bacterium]|nr:HigA family addiction module antitoxin [Bacteroidota bacterium]